QVMLGNDLHINGDLSVCAGNLSQASGVTINGKQSTGCNRVGGAFSGTGVGGGSSSFNVHQNDEGPNPIAQFFGSIIKACAAAALAALLAVIFPNQLNRMTNTAMSVPVTTAIAGFLSMIVAGAVTAIYGITVALTVVTCIALPIVGL